jgi:hypothetical protein
LDVKIGYKTMKRTPSYPLFQVARTPGITGFCFRLAIQLNPIETRDSALEIPAAISGGRQG